jgi:glutathione S-transferase
MSLELYFHPFASYCQKVLIALYENDIPFEPRLVDLGDEHSAAAFKKIWPIGKFPVLRDTARDVVLPESSIINEYLALHYPGKSELVPGDPELALRARLGDRFFDLHVNDPMAKIVTDRIRPPGKNDPHGVATARAQLDVAYDILEKDLKSKTWAIGSSFTMADCSAAPALYYANLVSPFGEHRGVAAYFDRLMGRASFQRVLREAEPYLVNFPR